MPEISAFCPGCGRSVARSESPETWVPPFSRDALLAALAYVTFVPALLLLAVPSTRKREIIRLHAWQSIVFVAASLVVAGCTRLTFALLAIFPFAGYLLGWLLAGLVALALFFVWILLIVKAAMGEAYLLPGIATLMARLSGQE